EGGLEFISKNIPLSLDFFNHADVQDTERVAWWTCQHNGMDAFTYYTYSQPIKSNNGYCWGLWQYWGQERGEGPINEPIGTSGIWKPALSVRGQAWRQWQTDWIVGRAAQ